MTKGFCSLGFWPVKGQHLVTQVKVDNVEDNEYNLQVIAERMMALDTV